MKLQELIERALWGSQEPEHDFHHVWKTMAKSERKHFMKLAYDILERDYGHKLSSEQIHSLSMHPEILADIIDNYDAADDIGPDSAISKKAIQSALRGK